MADVQPQPTRTRTLNANLLMELMRSNNSPLYRFADQLSRTLPNYIDDVERDYGHDIYERMMRDDAAASSIDTIKEYILSGEHSVVNRIKPVMPTSTDAQAKIDFDTGEEVRAWIEDMLDGLQMPFMSIMWNVLDALAFGHKVAEIVYDESLPNGQYVMRALKVKPNNCYSFEVDDKMNIIGLKPRGSLDAEIYPLEKFLIYSFDVADSDPRGTSLLRAAYNMWYFKQRLWPSYMKYLDLYGMPNVALIMGTAPNAIVDADGDSDLQLTGDEKTVLLAELGKFLAGSGIVLDPGSKVETVEATGNGEAFLAAFDRFDRGIVRAVLKAVRAIMESQFGSRADSAQADDVLTLFAKRVRWEVQWFVYKHVLFRIVELNYGTEYAKRYTPFVSFSNDQQDIINFGNMVANLERTGYWHISQKPAIDAKLGLPRDWDAVMAEIEEQKQIDEQNRQLDMQVRQSALETVIQGSPGTNGN